VIRFKAGARGTVPPNGTGLFSRREQALTLAAAVDPDLLAYTHPDGPILLFETCR
jgi:hypothetical protein